MACSFSASSPSLPVAIAGLGWGWRAGALSALTGAGRGRIGSPAGPAFALFYLIAIGAPAAVFSYLALLNRAVGNPGRRSLEQRRVVSDRPHRGVGEPLGRATAATAVLSIGTDTAAVRAAMLDMLEKSHLFEVLAQNGAKLTPDTKNDLAAMMAAFLPMTIAMMWFAVIVINMWMAGRITLASGRLSRPWPDLSALTLPPALAVAFGLAVLATQVADLPGLIAFGFTGAFIFAFMLVGLGVLHRLTRGYALRPAVLAMIYVGLMFMPPFSQLLIALVGLAEPLLRARIPPGTPPPSIKPT